MSILHFKWDLRAFMHVCTFGMKSSVYVSHSVNILDYICLLRAFMCMCIRSRKSSVCLSHRYVHFIICMSTCTHVDMNPPSPSRTVMWCDVCIYVWLIVCMKYDGVYIHTSNEAHVQVGEKLQVVQYENDQSIHIRVLTLNIVTQMHMHVGGRQEVCRSISKMLTIKPCMVSSTEGWIESCVKWA